MSGFTPWRMDEDPAAAEVRREMWRQRAEGTAWARLAVAKAAEAEEHATKARVAASRAVRWSWSAVVVAGVQLGLMLAEWIGQR